EALDRVGDDRRVADALEGPVHPAPTGELADGLDGVDVRTGLDEVGGPEGHRQLLLLRKGVDGDDPVGVAELGRLDDVEPDAADAEDGDVLAVADVRPVEGRAG